MLFWFLIALILIWALTIPALPYHRRYGYGYFPFGAVSAVLLIFILLWWIGIFAVAWPT